MNYKKIMKDAGFQYLGGNCSCKGKNKYDDFGKRVGTDLIRVYPKKGEFTINGGSPLPLNQLNDYVKP